MKKLIILSILIVTINSCIKESFVTGTYHVLTNNSEHIVKIYSYDENQVSDSTILLRGNYKEYSFKDKAGGAPLPFGGDSLLITYDDTISIKHTNQEEQVVKRSLLDEKSWLGGKVDDYKYQYEYVFTNDDYQEAVDNQ